MASLNSFKSIFLKANKKYENLITAHQLNDKLEWFLMQLSKGAGLVELIGFNEFEQKENFKIYKPLLNITKDELENYFSEEESERICRSRTERG